MRSFSEASAAPERALPVLGRPRLSFGVTGIGVFTVTGFIVTGVFSWGDRYPLRDPY